MQHTLVAVFDNRSDAQSAMDELLASGYARSDVNVSSADASQTDSLSSDASRLDTPHEEGIGASIKHFFTNLFGADSDDHVSRYSDVVSRGHHVLTITTQSEPEVERAADVIERFGPIDIDERHDLTGSAASLGASAYQPQASSASLSGASMQSASSTSSAGTSSMSQQSALPPGTEPGALQTRTDNNLYFGTQDMNDTAPRDMTFQETQGRSLQSGNLMDDESRKLNATGSVQGSSQGGTLQGTASLPGSDDASLGGTAYTSGSMQRDLSQPGSTPDSGKRSGVRVYSRPLDQGSASGTSSASSLNSDDAWRADWDSNYSSLGGSYDDYAPAYKYGNEMRKSDQYKNRDWSDIESDLKSNWESRNTGGPSTWEKMKAAVRHGWDKITPDMNDDSDDYYRNHYSTQYAATGDTYDSLAPAYGYGNEARRNPKYQGRNWDDVESDLRSDWDTRYPSSGGVSTWDKMKAAVRHGWEKMTS
jgi:hypothetical protein